jgi:hypothetical protein
MTTHLKISTNMIQNRAYFMRIDIKLVLSLIIVRNNEF